MKEWTLKDIEKHYEELEEYDEINKKADSHMRRFIEGYALSSIKDGARVLDILCRTGLGSIYFGERKKLNIIGMDISKRMLSIAEKRTKEKEIPFKGKLMTSFNLPLKDNHFDNILCFESLEHIPNPDLFLYEINRVLKPKGELIITTPNHLWDSFHTFAALIGIHHSEGPHRFIPRKEILQLLKKNNFKIRKEKTTVLIPIGPKFLIKIGKFFEGILPESALRFVALRRIFVCEK